MVHFEGSVQNVSVKRTADGTLEARVTLVCPASDDLVSNISEMMRSIVEVDIESIQAAMFVDARTGEIGR